MHKHISQINAAKEEPEAPRFPGLQPDPARYLVPVDLDRTRVLFFDNRAAFRIYQRYGAGFWRELFESDPNGPSPAKKDEPRPIRLRSLEAFEFFLWVGLQRDAEEAGGTLTVETIQQYIVPTSIAELFNALLVALAATRTPQDKKRKNAVPAGATGAPAVQ